MGPLFFQPYVTEPPASRTDRHVLAGTITVNGSPARRRVAVFTRDTLELVAATLSDPATGVWRISNINEYPERSLLVVAFDDAGDFNAEVADFVTQVAQTQGG